jgi:hypothetical protein
MSSVLATVQGANGRIEEDSQRQGGIEYLWGGHLVKW